MLIKNPFHQLYLSYNNYCMISFLKFQSCIFLIF
nr:MAG TPA: hypothetical protein [Bacteriophage sp.]